MYKGALPFYSFFYTDMAEMKFQYLFLYKQTHKPKPNNSFHM